MHREQREWQGLDVARRPWTSAERRVVLRGFCGRLSVAIEPFVVAVFFALLPLGLMLRQREIALLLAPIFAFASLAFLIYAIALIVPSLRALLETFGPIYTVDGYVHYRRSRSSPTAHQENSVAVLSADRRPLGVWPLREWPRSIGERELWPVVVEFSRHGGIHKIDGRPTGVLPAEMTPLGIGVAQHDQRRAAPRS
jgi:hypothetical protein